MSLTKKEASASDEACEDENRKFVGTNGLKNDPATCPGVQSRKVKKRTTITTEVFARNESDEALFSNFYYKRVLKNGEVVDCPNLICSASKIESVAATANVLALDVQSHFTQYLQRGDILVIHELITALSAEVCWRDETGGHAQDLALSHQRFQPL